MCVILYPFIWSFPSAAKKGCFCIRRTNIQTQLSRLSHLERESEREAAAAAAAAAVSWNIIRVLVALLPGFMFILLSYVERKKCSIHIYIYVIFLLLAPFALKKNSSVCVRVYTCKVIIILLCLHYAPVCICGFSKESRNKGRKEKVY